MFFALLHVHCLNGVDLPIVGPVRAIGPPSRPGATARGHMLDIDDEDVTWHQIPRLRNWRIHRWEMVVEWWFITTTLW